MRLCRATSSVMPMNPIRLPGMVAAGLRRNASSISYVQVSPASSDRATCISPRPSMLPSSVVSSQATCTVPSGATTGWEPCTTRFVPSTPGTTGSSTSPKARETVGLTATGSVQDCPPSSERTRRIVVWIDRGRNVGTSPTHRISWWISKSV